MIGADQNFGALIGGFIGFLNRGRQCVDIIGTIKIWANCPSGRLPGLFDQASEKFIIGRGGRGPSKLRVERKEQNFLAAGLDHFLHNGLGGRIAVAHAIFNHNMTVVAFRNFRPNGLGLRFCYGRQGAFIRLHIPN